MWNAVAAQGRTTKEMHKLDTTNEPHVYRQSDAAEPTKPGTPVYSPSEAPANMEPANVDPAKNEPKKIEATMTEAENKVTLAKAEAVAEPAKTKEST
jgi:hypothetical protein